MTDKLKNLGVFKDFDDGSLKNVFEKEENEIIEITLIQNKDDIDVVCVPTHHFCNLGCKMCHLTNNGLNKTMKPVAADSLIEGIARTVCRQREKPDDAFVRRTKKSKLLVSFMGVGEPLLNLKLLEGLCAQEAYLKNELGYKDIGYAVSTIMPNDNALKLMELAEEKKIPVKLHFSMHTPVDEERFHLIPMTKVTIQNALDYLKEYQKKLSANKAVSEKNKNFHKTNSLVEIHYTLIKDVNDTDRHLELLGDILKNHQIPIKFIRFNPIDTLERSENEAKWLEILGRIPGVDLAVYSPPGRQIGSSCGEFTKHYYHMEIETDEQRREFEIWKKRHQVYENHRTNYISWEQYFMGAAILSAQRSKDPNTQVGACIVSRDNRILGVGYNGTPAGIEDESLNWKRDGDFLDSKYAYVMHAEQNAVLNFKGSTRDLDGARLYITLFPCNECAKFLAQTGISEIIYLSDKYHDVKEFIAGRAILDRCGIKHRQFEENGTDILLKL